MDRTTRTVVVTATALGALAGMRGLSAPALLSRHLARNGARWPNGRAQGLLSSRRLARTLTALACAEMIVDKLPFMPPRTEPLSVAGRAIIGGLAGAAVAGQRRRSTVVPALAGALAATATAFASYHLRRQAKRRLLVSDPALGLVEDAFVIVVGSRLGAAVPRPPATRRLALRGRALADALAR